MKPRAVRHMAFTALACIVIGVIGSCGGGASPPSTPPTGTISGSSVSSSNGAVEIASTATVSGMAATSSTTAQPFTVNKVPVGDRVVVRLSAPGHIDQVKVVAVRSGVVTNLRSTLVPVGIIATVDPTAAVSVSVPGSTAQVSTPANAFVRADDGAAPSGNLTIAVTPIDPASDPARMPGDYTTLAGGIERAIESFGALGVTIQDSGGNRYNLGSGKTATIRIPLSSRGAGIAPATIPLFYLDEGSGRWVEQGTATLAGTSDSRYYEGTVSHFSFWNADKLIETIYVNGCIQFNGTAAPHRLVSTTGIDYSGWSQVLTNAAGDFRVPMRIGSRAELTSVVSGAGNTEPLVVGPSASDITLTACLQERDASALPPSFVSQPLSATVEEGTLARFSVVVDGSLPIGVQWRRNGVNIVGATGRSMEFFATAADNAAAYSAVATNTSGSTTSSSASLTVVPVLPADYVPGLVSTLAGSAGIFGSADGFVTEARFLFPTGVATDSAETVLVADQANNAIRSISAAGQVITFSSGAGFYVPFSLAFHSGAGLYATDTGNHTIRKFGGNGVWEPFAGTALSPGSNDGVGAAARFRLPTGVATDGVGNVYVADSLNHTIRKITPAGVVSTLAGLAGTPGGSDGTGAAARFFSPGGLATDASANVYVADVGNHIIRKITRSGVVTTIAGVAGTSGTADGTGTAARFMQPLGLATDGIGNVYVADYGNHTIRRISPTGLVNTIAGAPGVAGSADGLGSAARFNLPAGLVVSHAGILYVADSSNHTIRRITFP